MSVQNSNKERPSSGCREDFPHPLPLPCGAPYHLWDHRSGRHSTALLARSLAGQGGHPVTRKRVPCSFLPPLSHSGVLRVGSGRPPSQILGVRGTRERSAQPGPLGPSALPPTCPSRPPARPTRPAGSRCAFLLSPGVRLARTVPAAPRALGRRDTHRPGRRPGPENRWSRRGARDSRLSLTQKMKLNPKSRYLMHLLPPLTGMVQAGLAWDRMHARPRQKELDNRLRHAEARGWPEAPLLKSATPYGARPAVMRMCREMPTPPPTHLPRP